MTTTAFFLLPLVVNTEMQREFFIIESVAGTSNENGNCERRPRALETNGVY